MGIIIYLINGTPSSVLTFRRPLDMLFDHCVLSPIVHLLPDIFGCVICVHLHQHQHTKLEKRVVKCVFVGYGLTKKCYHTYHPTSKNCTFLWMLHFMKINIFILILHFKGEMNVKCNIMKPTCLTSNI